MAKEEQFDILFEVLRTFQSLGVLKNLMLIGSWCLYFYQLELKDADQLPVVRTLDADFLIPDERKLSRDVDLPGILKRIGFVPTHNRSNGLIVYDHPELRIEFLVPELGKGFQKPPEIKKLHVKAQGLRYLNLLADYPKTISYQGLSILVPEPAVFALHKLIVSSRRSNREKQTKDLETATGLLDFLLTKSEERERLQFVLKKLPKKWIQTIVSVCDKHYPKLKEIIEDLK